MVSDIEFKHTIVFSHLSVHLNITQIENMKKRLHPWMKEPHIHLILDFQDVRLIDCRMIGFLIKLNRRLQANHSALTLRNLTEEVRFIFDILKLTSVIHIEEKR